MNGKPGPEIKAPEDVPETCREDMIRAAIQAFDLCGSMVRAIDAVAADYAVPRSVVDRMRSGVFAEALRRIEASRPPDPNPFTRRRP